jgi:hypothetical protein
MKLANSIQMGTGRDNEVAPQYMVFIAPLLLVHTCIADDACVDADFWFQSVHLTVIGRWQLKNTKQLSEGTPNNFASHFTDSTTGSTPQNVLRRDLLGRRPCLTFHRWNQCPEGEMQ